MINKEYQMEESSSPSSLTYVIEIKDFSWKFWDLKVEKMFSTKVFHVNQSKFSVDLQFDWERRYVGLFLRNLSHWMVCTRMEVEVKNILICSSATAGDVLQPDGRLGSSFGWNECIHHDRCIVSLSADGTLAINIKVELLAEKSGTEMETQEQLTRLMKELSFLSIKMKKIESDLESAQADRDEEVSSLKIKMRKIESDQESAQADRDEEVSSLKIKIRKIESDLASAQADRDRVSHSEKCPMCIHVIKKPMRLRQCSRVSSLS